MTTQCSCSTLIIGEFLKLKHTHVFFVVIILLASIASYEQASKVEKIDLEETKALLDIYSERIATIIDGTIKATAILEELVILHNGNAPIDEVARLSKVLFDDEIHINLSYAPDGIVAYTYPLEGNEEALGHNLIEDPITKNDAMKAIDTGNASLSKPYLLRQGKVAAVVRDPVYIIQDGEEVFWGFIAIAMRTATGLIMHSDIDSLERFDYGYKLSYDYENEMIEIFRSENFDSTREAFVNTFNTRYGEWELTLYHVLTTTEKITYILSFSVMCFALGYLLFFSVIHLIRVLKKK